ncbi:MAG: hypothetical protein LBK70_03195 [Clostridiales bacterium]|nr:hypothetical protein [Clostridiales bacterium]
MLNSQNITTYEKFGVNHKFNKIDLYSDNYVSDEQDIVGSSINKYDDKLDGQFDEYNLEKLDNKIVFDSNTSQSMQVDNILKSLNIKNSQNNSIDNYIDGKDVDQILYIPDYDVANINNGTLVQKLDITQMIILEQISKLVLILTCCNILWMYTYTMSMMKL